MLRAYQCPFFRWEDQLKIHCEGGVLRWPCYEAMQNYIDAFCACSPGWKNCTVAQSVMKAYEGEGKENGNA